MPDRPDVGSATVSTDVSDRTITLAAGAFWGVEAALRTIAGVVATRVGYAEPVVAGGSSGAAAIEAVEVTFDPTRLPVEQLLAWFWSLHEPSQLARGDGDREETSGAVADGRYGSAVLWHTGDQQAAANASRDAVEARLGHRVVTLLAPIASFRAASAEWQQFADRHGVGLVRALPSETVAALGLVRPAQPNRPNQPNRPDSTEQSGRQGEKEAVDLRGLLGDQADELAQALLHSSEHLHVVGALVDEWRSALPGSPSIDGWRRLEVATMPVATEARLHATIEGAELTVVASLAPGNALPAVTSGWAIVRESRAGADRAIAYPAELVFCDDPVDVEHDPVVAGPVAGVSSGWYDHVPPAMLRIKTDDNRVHRVRWHQGEFELLDHPDVDLSRELTLAALGGNVCPCLVLLEVSRPEWAPTLWSGTSRPPPEPGLVSMSFGLFDKCEETADWRPLIHGPGTRRGPGPKAHVRPSRAEVSTVDGVGLWLTHLSMWLPFSLRGRLALTLLHRLDLLAAAGDVAARDLVQRALLLPLRRAALGTLWQWCRAEPAVTHGSFECRMRGSGETPHVAGTLRDGIASAQIGQPWTWLTRVWLRGLATVDGCFVVEVDDAPPGSEELTARIARWVETHRGPMSATLIVEPVTLTWTGTRWAIRQP